jgi:3-dehydroquinate dehydratase II
MTKILLVQGANLTFLGRREPEIYGTTTPAQLDAMLQRHAQDRGFFTPRVVRPHIDLDQ